MLTKSRVRLRERDPMDWIFLYLFVIWTLVVAGCVWACPFWQLKVIFALILPIGPMMIAVILKGLR